MSASDICKVYGLALYSPNISESGGVVGRRVKFQTRCFDDYFQCYSLMYVADISEEILFMRFGMIIR